MVQKEFPLFMRSLFFPFGQFSESRKASGLLILLVKSLGFVVFLNVVRR